MYCQSAARHVVGREPSYLVYGGVCSVAARAEAAFLYERVYPAAHEAALPVGLGHYHGGVARCPEYAYSVGRLKSARLNGKEIDPAGEYRIATLDFVAQGNDNMTAFKSSTDINSPTSKDNNVRFIIMKYMQEMMKQGKSVDAKIEGRIKIE